MKNFAADPSKPIRCSYMKWIATCTMHTALDFYEGFADTAGAAADNGSVTHKGVEAFHLTKGSITERTARGFDAMQKALADFPGAEYNECSLFYRPYCADSRNQSAEIAPWIDGTPAIEKEINFHLPPHPLDATKQNIYIQGHLDQIRIENGQWKVCDLKTGTPSAMALTHDAAYQLAGYVYGCWQVGLKKCQPGYIIRARRYRERNAELPEPSGVFIDMPFESKDVELILDQVRLNVALIRMGQVNFGTGPHCCYCHHRGLDGCLRKGRELLGISLA